MGKKKVEKEVNISQDKLLLDSHFVLRDIKTKMLLIIDRSNLSTSKATRLDVGSETAYRTVQRDRGRGVIMLIGSEEECEALVMQLEHQSLIDEYGGVTGSMKTSNGSSITFEKKCNENVDFNVVERLVKRKNDRIDIEIQDHFKLMEENNVDMCDLTVPHNKDDSTTNEGKNAVTNSISEKKKDDSDDNIEEEIDDMTDVTKSDETAFIGEENENTEDLDESSCVNDKSFEQIDNSNSDSVIQARTTSSHSNSIDEASKTAIDKKSLHEDKPCMKRSNTTSEKSIDNKRLKSSDDENWSSARLTALREENKKLKKENEFMKTHYIPRPNPETIDYLANVVSICTAGIPRTQNDANVTKNIVTLNLSKEELDLCVDTQSIRRTCRNIVRKVFKSELMDSTIPYSHILSNEAVMTAIRTFGRTMHPVESMKFTDGDLNNAMGSDFYRRGPINKKKIDGNAFD